jgi:hypothetical protein
LIAECRLGYLASIPLRVLCGPVYSDRRQIVVMGHGAIEVDGRNGA